MRPVQVLILTTSARAAWCTVARESLLREHPEAVIRPVYSDGRLLTLPAAGSIRPQNLQIGPVRYADLVLAWGSREAAWAALPWILEELVEPSVFAEGPVVVLSDSVQIFGELTGILDLASAGRPAARAAHVDPVTSLPWGGCLPGCLAVCEADGDLLTWWKSRTLGALSISDPSVEMERNWLWRDLPLGKSLAVLTDPSLRLSTETTHEIQIAGDSEGFTADAEPLVLIDMDGFDPTRPWWFAEEGQTPHLRVSESPGLRNLTHLVAERLMTAGWNGSEQDVIGALAGVDMTPQIRSWYRSLLAPVCATDPASALPTASRGGRPNLPPNPYVSGEAAAFLEQLLSADGAAVTGISNAADAVMAKRPDLQAAFPSVRWSDRDPFIKWMWSHGLNEGDSSLSLLPDFPRVVRQDAVATGARPYGVNLVGYLSGELGLGVAARRMIAAIEAAGIPCATVSYDRTSSRQRKPAERVIDAPYRYNLLLITADQLPFFVEDVGLGFFADHYNIGLWYWETDVLTHVQISSFAWVDEVWGATQYLCDVFDAYGRVPVRYMPVPLVFEDPEIVDGDRERLGLDHRFTVLFSFDFLSVVERKNPMGLIEAFCKAFEPTDGARLILKGINGDLFPDKLEQLLDVIADRPDIDLWDTYLSARDRLALVKLADCYASLHRSEGLGLTMAEAMALGTPVVATAYSGNLDFMDDTTALLVSGTEVLIGEGHLYPADGHWMDPDLEVAAAHLRRLFEDAELREQISRDSSDALRKFSIERVAGLISARLEELDRGQ